MQTTGAKTNRLRSGKLPKLSMQQQVENQEVADRMNRKIGFTRNPRHLASTLSYAQALATHSNSTPPSAFQVEPAELFFTDYDTHHIYES